MLAPKMFSGRVMRLLYLRPKRCEEAKEKGKEGEKRVQISETFKSSRVDLESRTKLDGTKNRHAKKRQR